MSRRRIAFSPASGDADSSDGSVDGRWAIAGHHCQRSEWDRRMQLRKKIEKRWAETSQRDVQNDDDDDDSRSGSSCSGSSCSSGSSSGSRSSCSGSEESSQAVEYSKYVLMLRAGVPKQLVIEGCEADGLDANLMLQLHERTRASDLQSVEESLEEEDDYYTESSGVMYDKNDELLQDDSLTEEESFSSYLHNDDDSSSCPPIVRRTASTASSSSKMMQRRDSTSKLQQDSSPPPTTRLERILSEGCAILETPSLVEEESSSETKPSEKIKLSRRGDESNKDEKSSKKSRGESKTAPSSEKLSIMGEKSSIENNKTGLLSSLQPKDIIAAPATLQRLLGEGSVDKKKKNATSPPRDSVRARKRERSIAAAVLMQQQKESSKNEESSSSRGDNSDPRSESSNTNSKTSGLLSTLSRKDIVAAPATMKRIIGEGGGTEKKKKKAEKTGNNTQQRSDSFRVRKRERSTVLASMMEARKNERASQQLSRESSNEAALPVSEVPPSYQKYALMLKAGIPDFRVRLLMELDGNDPAILFQDRSSKTTKGEKASKVKGKREKKANEKKADEKKARRMSSDAAAGAILKDKAGDDTSNKTDDEQLPLSKHLIFSRYFLMIKARVPRHRVRRVMEMDGHDPAILDMDPNRSYASQVVVVAKEQQQTRRRQGRRNSNNSGSTKERGSSRSSAKEDIMARRTATESGRHKNGVESLQGKSKDGARNSTSSKIANIIPVAGARVEASSRRGNDGVTQQRGRQSGKLAPSKNANIAALFANRSAGTSDTSSAGKQEVNKESSRNGDATKKDSNRQPSVGDGRGDKCKTTTGIQALLARRASMQRAARPAPKKKDSGPDKVEKPVEPEEEPNVTEEPTCSPPPLLKDDPEFKKYFKMLRLGLPLGAVKQAMVKDGKDCTILDLDHSKPLKIQRQEQSKESDAGDEPPILKEDPEFKKYFKMLKLGLPLGAVKQAMAKDGKDGAILDLDHNKPLVMQRPQQSTGDTGDEPPVLKDDPEFSKFFKMLKLGLPLGAVKQAMVKDGKDSTVLDLDHNKPLVMQRPDAKQSSTKGGKKSITPSKPKVSRKRIFWNLVDKSNLQGSLWTQVAESDRNLGLNGLEYDEEEFANLFTMAPEKEKKDTKTVNGVPSKGKQSAKRPASKAIQLIDGRRQMNGSILLAKYKHDYLVLAQKVNNMDGDGMCETELLALMQLLPSKDEALAIRSYIPASSGIEKDTAISKLGECEKYMASMLEVENASGKLKCMLYQAQFKNLIESLVKDLDSLREALACVRSSDRLKRLMVFALRLGNTLNDASSEKDMSAITLDSLLKLQTVKAFDKKTSVLHYLVKIIDKNDKDVLDVSQDLVPVLKAERLTMDSLATSMSDLREGLVFTKSMKHSGDGATALDVFVQEAEARLNGLSTEFQSCKQTFLSVLRYFGEDQNKPLNEFFGTISRFVAMFDSARAEFRKLEEAKARTERRNKLKLTAAKS